MEDILGQENLKLIREHLTWEENSKFMYDIMKSEDLDWPSLTVQWLPGVETPPSGQYTIQRLLMGTITSGQEQEYLLVADVHVPPVESDDESDEEEEEDTALQPGKGKAETLDDLPLEEICISGYSKRLPHDKEVNKARYMPQNPNVIATKSGDGVVYLFDLEKDVPSSSTTSAHQVKTSGTSGEGYALAWNPHRTGHLLSADLAICCWDTAAGSHDIPLEPIFRDAKVHQDTIEDVTWITTNTFASVADDNTLRTWDLREGGKTTGTVQYTSHLNALGYTDKAENRLLTGAADGCILQWDLRKLATSSIVHTFRGHKDEVFSIQCAPFHASIFASAGYDRGVFVWDIDCIGKTADKAEEEGGEDEEVPPELLFQHRGHTSRVLDLSWNPNAEEAWVMASVQDTGNLLHIWKPAQEILEEEGDEGQAEDQSDGHHEINTGPPTKRPKL